MTIALVGLGLIGGSLAKALKAKTSHRLLGHDLDSAVLEKAGREGSIDGRLTKAALADCDMLIIALYPKATLEYLGQNANYLKKGAIVIDCAGVKRGICQAVQPLAKEHGFIFVGGHPMAGTEFSGYDHSRANLFEGASMIVTPDEEVPHRALASLKEVFLSLGFGNFQVTSPDEHDKMIAFTSQLAHVVSNAYVKSPAALRHKGFSAGSYKDMTRVAKLNELMWSELFLDNGDYLSHEIDCLIERLEEYSQTIKDAKIRKLQTILKEGSDIKIFLNDE
ncbi:MAG: prephenate dehydrogenase [Clostridiales bacterium]|nr:prephenate dehydrogenase [Clostridiales bacterium]